MVVLDAITILSINSLVSLLLALMLLGMRQAAPRDIRGFGEWITATLLGFLVSVVLALRLAVDDPWMIGLRNLCLAGMPWYYYAGCCRFFRQPAPGRWLTPGLLAFGAFIALASLQGVPSLARLWFTVLAILVATLLQLRLLDRVQAHGLGANLLRVTLWIALVAMVFRLYLGLRFGEQGGVLHPAAYKESLLGVPMGTLTPLLYTVAFVFTSPALMLLVSERMREQLELLATRDSLTNLLNRRAFLDAANREIERSRRYGLALTLFQIDLDHFKRINDTHGHQTGDRVLVDFAVRVSALLRGTDVFGRIGGEEFVIVLAETDADEARVVGERILQALANADTEPRYSASIGGVTYTGEVPALDTLLAEADAALYRAKEAGRNRVEFAVAVAATESAVAGG